MDSKRDRDVPTFESQGCLEKVNVCNNLSWPPSIPVAHVDLNSGIAIWILQRWFPIFKITHIGCALVWTGMIASAFAPSLPWMTFTFGVIYGLGLGIFTVSLAIIVVMFFDKYRAIACGIKSTGFSLSPLLFARILVLMQDTYELRGTLLLCGAIMANATAFALLLKQPHWMKSRHKVHQLRAVDETSPAILNGPKQTISASNEPSDSATSKQRPSILRSLTVFRNPMFYVIVIYTAAVDYSKSSFQSTIVDYTMDKGLSLPQAESLVAYFSAAQLLGRLTIPLISDLGFLKRSTLVLCNVVLCGCTFIVLPHVTSFSYLLITCLLLATVLGSAAMMPSVLAADYLGVDSISAIWAAVGVASLPVYLGSPMIIGTFRDYMGAYDNFYRLHGAIQIFVGITFCFVCGFEKGISISMYAKSNAIYTVNG